MQKGQFRELSVSDEEDPHISVILLDSHRGIYFPPFAKANGPPLSPERETFYMLLFVQLLHSCPLQEENIPLHSCNLQGLHGPGPEAYCLDY